MAPPRPRFRGEYRNHSSGLASWECRYRTVKIRMDNPRSAPVRVIVCERHTTCGKLHISLVKSLPDSFTIAPAGNQPSLEFRYHWSELVLWRISSTRAMGCLVPVRLA